MSVDHAPLVISYDRFSAPTQSKGDSKRRQKSLADNYCRRQNLTLDNEIHDDGLSAWTGANADHGHMQVTILSMTAEEDRVAVEASSTGIANPANGKRYGNFYHLLIRVKDGQVALYKEYQDTLHVYDYMAD